MCLDPPAAFDFQPCILPLTTRFNLKPCIWTLQSCISTPNHLFLSPVTYFHPQPLVSTPNHVFSSPTTHFDPQPHISTFNHIFRPSSHASQPSSAMRLTSEPFVLTPAMYLDPPATYFHPQPLVSTSQKLYVSFRVFFLFFFSFSPTPKFSYAQLTLIGFLK
jgi:hypothetical protein